MNQKQQRHVEILTRLEAGALGVRAAAELLGVGVRQVRRLQVCFHQDGVAAVIHGNCGRQPVNGTTPVLVTRVLALAARRLSMRTKPCKRPSAERSLRSR